MFHPSANAGVISVTLANASAAPAGFPRSVRAWPRYQWQEETSGYAVASEKNAASA